MSNIDRNELKVQALTERVAQLTAEYENKIADLRVELTVVTNESQERISELEAQVESDETPTKSSGKSFK